MKKILTFLLFTVLISYGCSSKGKIKPSADSILADNAINSIDAIKQAYEDKNKLTLQNYLDNKLAEKIINNLFFEKAELTFTTRMVRIKDSSLIVNLNWHGAWLNANGQEIKNRGTANLVLQKETMKLLQIDGDNPFLISTSRE